MIAFGRLRQFTIGRRLDFETPITGCAAQGWIIMTDVRHGIEPAAAIDRRLYMPALAETPVAYDHVIGSILAINDDGDTRAARNHNIETIGRERPQRRSDQNG